MTISTKNFSKYVPHRQSLAVAALAFGALALWPTNALAHAHLEKSTPGDNAVVPSADAPRSIVLQFSEAIEPSLSKVEMHSETAKTLTLLDEHSHAPTPTSLEAGVKGTLAPGKYEVVWAVTSTDSHKSNGKLHFTVK